MISIGEKAWTWISGKPRFIARSRSRYLNGGMSGLIPPCMQTSVAPRATRVGDLRDDGLVGMVVGVGLPALALEAAELASDETDVGEVDIAIDDVGDFVADVFGARQVGALDHRAQIVALGGIERKSFLGGQFLALEALCSAARTAGDGRPSARPSGVASISST